MIEQEKIYYSYQKGNFIFYESVSKIYNCGNSVAILFWTNVNDGLIRHGSSCGVLQYYKGLYTSNKGDSLICIEFTKADIIDELNKMINEDYVNVWYKQIIDSIYRQKRKI